MTDTIEPGKGVVLGEWVPLSLGTEVESGTETKDGASVVTSVTPTTIVLANGHKVRVRRDIPSPRALTAKRIRDATARLGKTHANLWAVCREMTERRLSSLRHVPAWVMGVGR